MQTHSAAFNDSWTREELEVWTKAGLIPKELLEQSRWIELIDYVVENKEKLFQFYRRVKDGLDAIISLPTPSTLATIHELKVVDAKTGATIKTLEQVRPIDLSEDISIIVNARELKQWEQETAATKTLSRQEKKIFEATINTIIAKKKSITRSEIAVTIEEVIKLRKTGKVRHSGHFADSKLQRMHPGKNMSEMISPAIKEKVEKSEHTIKAIGIKLTPAEDKLINALYKLLHEKSENKDQESETFYAGNETSLLVPYGKETGKSTVLRIKPTDLYNEYVGKDTYSGKDIANIKATLTKLCDKKFIIQYDRLRKVMQGKKEVTLTDRIEDVQALIKIVSFYEGMTSKEVKALNSGDPVVREQKEELIIAFNPILTDQINSKYIEYPSDINRRTMIASGGSMRVTESIIDLRDYLMREISNGRYKCELNEETLIEQIRLGNYAKSSRKKLLAQKLADAIEANTKLGIILESIKTVGASGQLKYTFILNQNFE